MRRMGFALSICVSVATAGFAGELSVVHQEGNRAIRLPPDPHACWSQPAALAETAIASMFDAGWEIDSQVANDFSFDVDTDIVRARWWGVFW